MSVLTGESRSPFTRGQLPVAVLVAAVAVAVYANTLSHQFLNYDDPWQITQNPYIRSLSRANLWHILTRPIYNLWLPTTTLSYALDYALWGLDHRGFHLTNVLLHAGCSVLVFLLGCRLCGGRFWPALAAILFAVHPVHVEAVAWLSARKDLLSAGFLLLAVLAFFRWRTGARAAWVWYGFSLFAFLVSSRAKPTADVLPLLLVCLAVVWPEPSEGRGRRVGGPKWLLGGTLPFFLLAAAMSFADWYLARTFGYMTSGAAPPTNRVALLSLAYWRYLRLLVLPAHLSPQYRIAPPEGLLEPTVLAGAVLLAATAGLAAWALARRHPAGGSLAWYLVSVLPVCGLLPIIVPSPVADRYLYLPSVGACIFAAWALKALAGRLGRTGRTAVVLSLVVVSVTFAAKTWRRNQVWRTSEALWSSVLAADPLNYNAHTNLAASLYERGDLEGAREHYQRAADLAPGLLHVYRSLGSLALAQGDLQGARYWLEKALSEPAAHVLTAAMVRQTLALAHYQLGTVDQSEDDLPSAVANYEKACTLSESPDPRALMAAARVRLLLGQVGRAYGYLSEVARLLGEGSPELGTSVEPTRQTLAELLPLVAGRMKRAADRVTVARAATASGKPDVAEKYLRQALLEQPDSVEAAVLLGTLLREAGRTGEARAVIDRALALSPQDQQLLSERAHLPAGQNQVPGSSETPGQGRPGDAPPTNRTSGPAP
jgi:Flp pilus assembly protein TadD